MKKGLLIAGILLMMFLVSCSTYEQKIETKEPTKTIEPEVEVLLVCDECAEIGMEINIWSSQFETTRRAIFSVPNRTVVTRIDSAHEDGRNWIKIRYQGKTGWVLGEFVETR